MATTVNNNGPKLRVHSSCKCSICGKSEVDNVNVYDYWMFGASRFCSECCIPDDKEMAIRLDGEIKFKIIKNCTL